MNRPKGKKVNDTPFTSEDVQVDTRYANDDQSLDPEGVYIVEFVEFPHLCETHRIYLDEDHRIHRAGNKPARLIYRDHGEESPFLLEASWYTHGVGQRIVRYNQHGEAVMKCDSGGATMDRGILKAWSAEEVDG